MSKVQVSSPRICTKACRGAGEAWYKDPDGSKRARDLVPKSRPRRLRHTPTPQHHQPRDAPSQCDMAPTPLRIAQTSNEAKKQYKQHGPRIPEHQLKQLERGNELDTRAARIRETEERRRAAKKKREEKEEKEKAARKQMGVGLATQLIGYSHTQAQLKNGMEAFLGLKRRKEEEKRKKDAELAKKLEEIAQKVEKEPWDDDDDDADDIALHLPQMAIPFGEQYVDDDLDDDTLLEAHDIVMSDPMEAPTLEPQPPPPPASFNTTTALQPVPTKDDADFTRLHGPINKAVESVLDRLPCPLVELLSQDISLKLPDWNPSLGLLHKLNPLGVPPHRLRLKVGSVVSLLRDLNASSQLSKSQHLRVLRVEGHRLECLILDGQLEGTKAFLTRIAFPARYRNDDAHPFQRTQFPVRIATDYTPPSTLREPSPVGFKLPTMPSQARPQILPKRPVPATNIRSITNSNPGFKLPGLPASKSAPPVSRKPTPVIQVPVPAQAAVSDGWDDFLESGTQIARELSFEAPAISSKPYMATTDSPTISESHPPMSTQDFDFSIDDLQDAAIFPTIKPAIATSPVAKQVQCPVKLEPVSSLRKAHTTPTPNTGIARAPMSSIATTSKQGTEKAMRFGPKPKPLAKKMKSTVLPIDLSMLTPSQKPRSVPDHHPKMNKRKVHAPPTERSLPPAKRSCAQTPRSVTTPKLATNYDDFSNFCISTQDAASFFDDDDDFAFGGSPPIPV